MKYLVDSNVLIEILRDSPAGNRAEAFLKPHEMCATYLNVAEVFKWLERENASPVVERALPFIKNMAFEDFTLDDAILAGRLSTKHKLYLVDAIMLSVSVNHDITLATMDSEFSGVKASGARIVLLKK